MEIINDDKILFKSTINHLINQDDGCSIELVIRPECNQSCQYCYLYKYGKDSYPNRADNETIINNITMLIDYFIKENYKSII